MKAVQEEEVKLRGRGGREEVGFVKQVDLSRAWKREGGLLMHVWFCCTGLVSSVSVQPPKWSARKNVSKMNYFVPSGTLNLNSVDDEVVDSMHCRCTLALYLVMLYTWQFVAYFPGAEPIGEVRCKCHLFDAGIVPYFQRFFLPSIVKTFNIFDHLDCIIN